MRTGKACFLCVALIVTGSAFFPDGTWARTPDDVKNLADVPAIVEAHNRERATEKLGPLTADPKLEAAALIHARDMAQHNKMTHTGSDGSNPAQRIERQSYRYRRAGENVAYGASSVPEVMRLWMESPPHRKNILGDFTEVGIACVQSEDGTLYWAVDFGTPMPQLDPDRAVADVLDLFNAERKKVEKPPLKVEPKLSEVARRHASDMAAHNELRTKDDEGQAPFDRVEKSGYRFKRIGQASSSGQPTAAEVVQSWLEQPSNRESLLGDARDVGIGYATTAKGIPYWSLIYAEPRR